MRLIKALLWFGLATNLLGACATTRSYDAMLNDWVGKERDELIQEWGPPTKQEAFSTGDVAYEYLSTDGNHNPDHQLSSRELTGYNVGCRTVFVLNNSDVITGWRREGYNCRIR